LRNDGKSSNYKALHFVPSWRPPVFLQDFNGLDPFVFHVGVQRDTLKKFNTQGLQVLGAWLDGQWNRWVDQLPPPFAGEISGAPVCPALIYTGGASALTACTAITAMTFTSPS
jgi:hypothetical protein